MSLWSELVRERPGDITNFATGKMSGRTILGWMRAERSPLSGKFDNLLRERGVVETRQLARKALRRRGVSV